MYIRTTCFINLIIKMCGTDTKVDQVPNNNEITTEYEFVDTDEGEGEEGEDEDNIQEEWALDNCEAFDTFFERLENMIMELLSERNGLSIIVKASINSPSE